LTLIVGILCQDGVVVGSDSAATFGTAGVPTIGQQAVTKIHRLTDSILFSSTGAIGIAQLVAREVQKAWIGSEFKNIHDPAETMNFIGKKIAATVGPYLQTANLSRPLVGDCSSSLCKSLVAMPVRREPCLFTFDYNGAPEQATTELPFVSLGSGQPIADPFLALLKRLLWIGTKPSMAEGRLAAVWAIDHVRLTNPGGVGGPIQLAVLAPSEGKQPTVTTLTEHDIQEHLEQVRAAEGALVRELRPDSTEEVVDLPKGP
jgi:20S proteasome alpha/beta subunit